ncbi:MULTISPECIES: RagB/SusD family nutrient uptake outer membrane protein [Zobellia]|uniref:SusD/RagB family lipoprotein n=1 Tax=Zobellia galactanivorans (strain DSM 12802 / CCUG 47099 / CIP 106680 / NCIMB 13871 / Dsij) TaxID=63186 RepID=G0L575_ZOBGA|nr:MULTISPECIES: RagB/SusD family nutrient uptake outer membrane protein [Zobellia]MBU3026506.1 RagB/SusD family nutrient uptake outer membrane protein [Zobellia galactanivorans]OWW26987.1 RagB/SusD family nutrient uptake outer membrane protein [Zobellia sp. OII3]CAZ95996.1 SusD/RagB family lipoprotein [Zobellia galactanivorans]
MKLYKNKFLLCSLVLLGLGSCQVQEFSDLNSPEVEAFQENITRGDLPDLVGGILYSSRVNLGNYFDDTGVIGREFFRFSASDPRLTGDLLGGGTNTLDNNTFYITNPWAARYRTVKNANLILGFIDGPDQSDQFSDEELNATKGFLKTFIAYELLLNLNLTDENGIRLDVADEQNLGPFVSKSEALSGIRTILEDAATDLGNGGDAFPFFLPSGFDGFDTPATFLEANQAIAARVATYQGDAAATLSFLENSFMNLTSAQDDLSTGLYYNFSEDQTDALNPMYFPVEATAAGARIAQPTFLSDAEAGDNRLSKVAERSEPLTQDGLTGGYAVALYKTDTDPIPMIRNEELILMYAEANITVDPIEAVAAIDLIRESAGLPAYTGNTDAASLIDEVLNQRRYSLYAEGHRWIDMRRYGRLDELPKDRPEDDVWTMFPIPLTENQ